MTRTEERLVDALNAAARAVQPASLHPLPADLARPRDADRSAGWAARVGSLVRFRADHRRRLPGRRRLRGRRPRWLVPAAAAAAVALIAGVSVAVAGHLKPAAPARPAQILGGPPKYYVEDLAGGLFVAATATGGTTPLPVPKGTAEARAVAAAADDHTFVALYDSLGSPPQILLYLFRISSSGQVREFAQIKGGVLSGHPGESLAVSPDASKVALTVSGTGSAASEIVVIDVRTGAHSLWRGGLDRPGYVLDIRSLSWTGDGGSLAFEAQWCLARSRACSFPLAPSYQIRTIDQIGSLGAGSHGGRLNSGRILLSQSQYPGITSALISPDGSTITALAYRKPGAPTGTASVLGGMSVVRVAITTGKLVDVLFRGESDVPGGAALSSDGTGRYLLVGYGVQPGSAVARHGWIDRGRFHLLRESEDVLGMAW